jgi:ABC-2 type transport system permease protein
LIKRLLLIGGGLLLLLSAIIIVPFLAMPGFSFNTAFITLWLVYALYLLMWLVIFYFIIRFGKGQADQALKMVGFWLLLTVAIPGTINQYILLNNPADLMMDMIEASRDGQS